MYTLTSGQNVFIFADGGTKATMAELERRKFTAEEGVSWARSLRKGKLS